MRHTTTSLRLIPLAFAWLAACADTPRTDPRADSIAAAQARQAEVDSIEAIQLVNADTALAQSLRIDLAAMEKRPSGLYVQDRRRGTGAVADSGKWIQVHYTTWLADGTLLDDTRKSGEPRRVLLGYREVVAAWDEGLRGMRAGGRRVLVSPPSLAYGKPGRPGSVPRLATLVFDIELLRVY
jgi:FKBP-type peptidyl-prolyl cis-trans isomerase FkpA